MLQAELRFEPVGKLSQATTDADILPTPGNASALVQQKATWLSGSSVQNIVGNTGVCEQTQFN